MTGLDRNLPPTQTGINERDGATHRGWSQPPHRPGDCGRVALVGVIGAWEFPRAANANPSASGSRLTMSSGRC